MNEVDKTDSIYKYLFKLRNIQMKNLLKHIHETFFTTRKEFGFENE